MNAAEGDDFGKQLTRYRKRQRLSQTALSGLAAVSVRAIRNLEQGQVLVPRLGTVQLLADALRLSGNERHLFELAGGSGAEDAMFGALGIPPSATSRPLRGRDGEMDMVLKYLRAGPGSITTITGFGGVGKTRLAAAAAETLTSLNSMPVLWISLEHAGGRPVANIELSADFGRHDGLWDRDTSELCAGNGGETDQLVRLINDRAALLVLDGNERDQVVAASKHQLLRDCSGLRILETTRTPQGGDDEFQLALRPLPTPAHTADRRAALDAPAVRLLTDEITEQQPDLRIDEVSLPLLVEICDLLDGLPGALRAAGSWSSVISLEEVREMARDEPHLLAAKPGDSTDTAATELEDAVDTLPDSSRALLVRLSGWREPWSVGLLSDRLNMPRTHIARTVQMFLQRGLVKKVDGGDSSAQFDLLNVVRSTLQAQPA